MPGLRSRREAEVIFSIRTGRSVICVSVQERGRIGSQIFMTLLTSSRRSVVPKMVKRFSRAVGMKADTFCEMEVRAFWSMFLIRILVGSNVIILQAIYLGRTGLDNSGRQVRRGYTARFRLTPPVKQANFLVVFCYLCQSSNTRSI